MIGDIPEAAIIIGGILSLIVAIKIWRYDSAKEKKRKEEREKYQREFFALQIFRERNCTNCCFFDNEALPRRPIEDPTQSLDWFWCTYPNPNYDSEYCYSQKKLASSLPR